MVDEQIVGRGVSDPIVLEAMRAVPRHRFVTEEWQDQAYADHQSGLPRADYRYLSHGYFLSNGLIVRDRCCACSTSPAMTNWSNIARLVVSDWFS